MDINNKIDKLKKTALKDKIGDFLLTWEHSKSEIESIINCAEILKELHKRNISYKLFESGLAVSIFKDKSTRTRFSFVSAADSLGLTPQEFDREKSQAFHGETVKETANMISFLTEVIGIRDDKYLGEGDSYQRKVSEAVDFGYKKELLNQRPTVVNLQSDLDHPTQALSDLAKIKKELGGLSKIKGKKVTVSWAYSPSYGKPLSVSQGVLALLSRYGADLTLAHPPGYELLGEIEQLSKEQADKSGGSFKVVNDMDQAFEGASVVYPKSWAPMSIMKEKSEEFKKGNLEKVKELNKEELEENQKFSDWECDERRMNLTDDALYMHPLPADVSRVNCKRGEVSKKIFEKSLSDTYEQASYKPFIIAAIILLSKTDYPANFIESVMGNPEPRKMF